MIVFLSDLHLSDGSAGVDDIPASAFRDTFHSLADRARRSEAKRISLVFLGDLFDLIRTERWFAVPVEKRPWGASPCESAAASILDAVLHRNAEVFHSILGGSLQEQFGFPVEPERVYIPGNHDRLCNVFPSLRRRVRETLRISGDLPFAYTLLDLDHGVFARHGHEWDRFNFEGEIRGKKWEEPDPECYQTPSIGEVLACEVVSRLPKAVLAHLRPDHPSHARLEDRLCGMFDVRPLLASTAWLAYQMEWFDDPEITDAINRGVRDVLNSFERLPFVQDWIRRHQEGLNPFSAGRELKWLVRLLETFRLSTLEHALPLLGDLANVVPDDNYASRAARDFERLDSVSEWRHRIRYVVYGHTHEPEVRGISVVGKAPDEIRRVYINNGMWRPTHEPSLERGFVTWDCRTYSVIYAPGERPGGSSPLEAPAFEAWTGAWRDR